MQSTTNCILIALILLAGIIGCDTKPQKVPSPRAYTPHAYPQPVVKTDSDYVQEVIDTIAIYKKDIANSVGRTGQQLDNSGNADEFTKTVTAITAIQKASNDVVLFVNRLNQLDISKCPSDFKAYYRIYVEKYSVLANSFYRISNYDEETGLIGNVLEVVKLGAQGEQYKKDCEDAENALFQLAKNKYGATIP